MKLAPRILRLFLHYFISKKKKELTAIKYGMVKKKVKISFKRELLYLTHDFVMTQRICSVKN